MRYINSWVVISRDFKNEIILLRNTQTPTRASPGKPRGGGGMRPILHKRSCDISILGVWIAGISKMRSVFLLRYPQTPTRASLGEPGGSRGTETYTAQKIMWYINSGGVNSRDFKSEITFLFRILSDHNKGVAGEAKGGGGGGLRPILYKKSCNISILGVWIAGISKMRSVFLLGYPQTPTTASPGKPSRGGGGGLRPILHKR